MVGRRADRATHDCAPLCLHSDRDETHTPKRLFANHACLSTPIPAVITARQSRLQEVAGGLSLWGTGRRREAGVWTGYLLESLCAVVWVRKTWKSPSIER
jgi:hypothetical protein